MKLDRILLISSLIQFGLFIPVARWARKHRQPLAEVIISRLAQRKQPSLVRKAVMGLDIALGSSTVLNVLVVPIAIALWKKRLRLESLATVVTCWTSALVREVMKRLINRPRPNPLLVHVTQPAKGKSFPSGDVATSLGLWGWLLALGLLSKNEKLSRKAALMSVPAACVMFIGPARIYLGDHWASDVLGGYLFGGGWLSLSLYLYRQVRYRTQRLV